MQFLAPVHVGGAGELTQQSGRARHMAGMRPNLDAIGAANCDGGGRCACPPDRRRLLVRHPLDQIRLLLSAAEAHLFAKDGDDAPDAQPPSSSGCF